MKPILSLILLVAYCATYHPHQRAEYTRYTKQYAWMTSEIYSLVLMHSRARKIDSRLVFAVIDAESGGNPQAVSKSGARGLMQIMAKHWGEKDYFSPAVNIHTGTMILAYCLKRARGDVRLALKGYERGFNGKGFNEPYIRKIMRNWMEKVVDDVILKNRRRA